MFHGKALGANAKVIAHRQLLSAVAAGGDIISLFSEKISHDPALCPGPGF